MHSFCLSTLILSLSLLTCVGVLSAADEKSDEHQIPAAAKAILDHAETLELLSLQPSEVDLVKDGFHGHKILGKTTLQGEDRQKLVAAFEKGVADYKEGPARCFIPRHGIRVTHGGKTAEFVICFECSQVHAYVDGQRVPAFLVGGSPAKLFNGLLQQDGIPLPAPPAETK